MNKSHRILNVTVTDQDGDVAVVQSSSTSAALACVLRERGIDRRATELSISTGIQADPTVGLARTRVAYVRRDIITRNVLAELVAEVL